MHIRRDYNGSHSATQSESRRTASSAAAPFSPLLRIRFIAVLFLLIGLAVTVKLYSLQVLNGDLYRDRAEHQYINPNQNVFDRGSIYFTNKDTTLYGAASVKSGFLLTVDPVRMNSTVGTTTYSVETSLARINDAFKAHTDTSEVTSFDREGSESKIRAALREGDRYVELVKRVDATIAEEIKAAKLPGVSLYRDRWRYYPGDSLAAHVIGLMGFKDDEYAGRYGLERTYEENLNRTNAAGFTNFFAELFTGLEKSVSDTSALEGDVVTTIEPTVQQQLEKELADINEKWNPERAGGIVMDPYTGAIRAIAVTPTYNPNDPSNANQKHGISVFSNPMVEGVYEMGSIIKPLTVAAGLDVGAVKPTTTYDDTGFINIDGYKISNYDGKARGKGTTMQMVLSQSLNLGVAFVVRTMGKEKFADYMRAFGLGEETGIDLPNESHGLIDNLNTANDVAYATASFGQGVAMSPIATVRALASLGNGGFLPNPHLVERIDYRLGFSKKLHAGDALGRQVIKPETSAAVTRMLVEVVDKALRDGKIKMDRYSVAAKTGTAQIARTEGRGYYDDRFLHSFFGYFPAYKPRYIVFFFQIHPKGAKYASETLTDSFANMTKFLINYYEIPPDR